MNNTLRYLSLARKAGKAELGEEPVGAAARALHAHVILVAKDASDHTWRRAKSFAAGTNQQCVRLDSSKDEMGQAIGRSALALAAFTDPALALAFVKVLEPQDKYKEVLESLDKRTQRVQQRQAEARAHKRNKRMGRKSGAKQ